jgi:hypothetical protein
MAWSTVYTILLKGFPTIEHQTMQQAGSRWLLGSFLHPHSLSEYHNSKKLIETSIYKLGDHSKSKGVAERGKETNTHFFFFVDLADPPPPPTYQI